MMQAEDQCFFIHFLTSNPTFYAFSPRSSKNMFFFYKNCEKRWFLIDVRYFSIFFRNNYIIYILYYALVFC